MASEHQVRELKQSCAAIMELAPRKDSFIRRSQWGDINFEIIENDIETIFWIVEEIDKLPINLLPGGIVNNSTSILIQIRRTFDEIDGFQISEREPSFSRDSISKKLRTHVESIISGIGPLLSLLVLRAGEIENWTSRAKGASDQIVDLLRETKSHVTTQRQQIDESAQAARAAAGEAGAAEFTDEFRKEADAREKRSIYWIWPTAIFSGSALLLSIAVMFGLFEWFGWLDDTPTNVWEAVYGLGGRVIAISVLFYAAVWSGRIVLANMNLASVNRHRAVSLQTLQAFHKSVEDPAAKDAVVLEAARAVYENVPSGYIGRQATGPGAGSRTLEVIRGANRASRTTDES